MITSCTNICFTSDGNGAPEPPTRYNPNNAPNPQPGPQMPQGSGPSRNEYVSIRRYIIFSEVLALVSLLFGGMLLSGVALIVAILGRRKAASGMLANQGNPLWQALYRSSFIAIVMCAVALVLNLISAIFLYPMLMEMLQTGDYGALFGFGQPGSSVAPGTGNSTWG